MLQHGQVAAPQFTAELLLAHAVRADRVYLRAHSDRELTDVEQVHFARYLRDRLAGVPTQYITGRQEFWGLEIRVNPSVLIPRPETEHVVERSLALARRESLSRILDCGAGSGCIALALASELPGTCILASDISAAALNTAAANAQRLNLAPTFVCADLLESFRDSSVDLLVSNPPYIAFSDAPTLAREVRDHEPAAALFAGPDGVDVYRRLIPDAARVLRPGGWAVVEIGHNVANAVRELFSAPVWRPLGVDRDLAGLDRVMYAQRV